MDASQLSKQTKKHQNQTDTENMARKVQNKCKTKQNKKQATTLIDQKTQQ